ncbi:MAG: GAF domain-containing protein [Pseudanabaenaceae cyanobacterium]
MKLEYNVTMIKQVFSKAVLEKVFTEMIMAFGGQVYVWNALEQMIWDSVHGLRREGTPIEELIPNYQQIPRLPLVMGRESLGYIAASGAAINHLNLLRDWLNFTVTQEWQKQAITQDALEKYEEINFLYDISQAMACCLTIQEVGTLVIDEINRLLPFSQAAILLLNKSRGVLERIPHVNTVIHEGHQDDLPKDVSTDDGIIGMVMNTGRAELVNDVEQDQRYLLYRFHHQSLAKSMLCVPLKTRQRVMGVIYLDALTTNAYTAKDMTMLLALSFQAALSIENVQFYHQQIILEQERNTLAEQLRSDYARELEKSVDARTKEFYEELEERQRAVAILRSQNFILEKIAANHSLKQVLTTILEFVELYADGAFGCVMLVETDQEQRRILRSIAAPSIPDTYCKAVDGMLVGPDIGACGNSAYWGKLTVTADISIDPKWNEVRAIALSHGLRACWSKPIFTTGGEVLGTIAFYYQTPRSPTAQEFDLLARAGHLAQIAIERNLAEKHLRQAKEKAEVASRAKSEFLANMGHDLRTPLNAILGFTQLLLQEEGNPHQLEQLEIINRSGEHLLAMINDILEVSKLEAGKLNVRLGNFNLRDMLANLKEIFLPTAQRKQIYLDFQIEDQVPEYVISDQEKLQKSLVNLLDNALKFTDIGGVTLWVSFIRNPDELNNCDLWEESDYQYHQLEFKVSDTGIGIAPSEINDLFDVFNRTRVKEGGTGLGLAISRRFIDLLGGKIAVQSQVGVGTLFHFQIKIQLAEPNLEGIDESIPSHNSADNVSSSQILNNSLDDSLHDSLSNHSPSSAPASVSESEKHGVYAHTAPNYHSNVMPVLPSFTDLGIVDPHWLQEVYRATMQINGNRVNQLLDQLGGNHSLLTGQIRALVNGFRFDLLLKTFNDFFDASGRTQPQNTSASITAEPVITKIETPEPIGSTRTPPLHHFPREKTSKSSLNGLLKVSAESNGSVLIIEPSLVHRHLLQKSLEHFGYKTKSVSNLTEGKNILPTETMLVSFIDLDQLVSNPGFLLDINEEYPEMLLVGLSNLPLVELKQYYSEKTSDDSSISTMFNSLNDYLIKPISLEKVTDLIEQWQPLLKP